MQCLKIELVNRLDGDESHGWALHGLSDCFGSAGERDEAAMRACVSNGPS
jgi:hypothetical protein